MKGSRLLETLRWTPEAGYAFLAEHLARLERSARELGYAGAGEAAATLAAACAGLRSPARVRLLLDEGGVMAVETAPLPANGGEPLRVALAVAPVDSRSTWLRHKTTARRVYEEALASRPGCDEVLLWNERGEVTEATTANLVARLDGRLVTPPLECGLLPGTMRAALLARGEVAEAVLKASDLPRCDELWLINSVRLWRRAVLVEPGGSPG
jgi:branched-subunit amino acid aminotransferase/4-amino-4-deoxychorismate lyase